MRRLKLVEEKHNYCEYTVIDADTREVLIEADLDMCLKYIENECLYLGE